MIAHRKVVKVSPGLLAGMLEEGAETRGFRCVEGLPAGAVFVRGYYDGMSNVFGLVFEHPDWEAVRDDGREMEELTPVLEVVGG